MVTKAELRNRCDVYASDPMLLYGCQNAFDICDTLPAQRQAQCRDNVVVCADERRDQTCFWMSRIFTEPDEAKKAKTGASEKPPVAQPQASDEAVIRGDNPASADAIMPPPASPPSLADWEPDGKTKFAVSFRKAGFGPLSERKKRKELRLGVAYGNDGYNPIITIDYSVTPLGNNRYRMEYRFTRADGATFGDKANVCEFEGEGTEVKGRFCFGITLGEEGNFRYIKYLDIFIRNEDGSFVKIGRIKK